MVRRKENQCVKGKEYHRNVKKKPTKLSARHEASLDN